MKRSLLVVVASLVASMVAAPAMAGLIGIAETNGEAGAAAVIAPNAFGEDEDSYVDRTHEHNGAAYDSATGLLSITGDVIVPLPAYLVGKPYIKTANNARDNAGYKLHVTVDAPAKVYALVDNRLDGPAGDKSSSNTTPPVLGGSLQWLIDDGYSMTYSGLFPGGQPDFSAIDESGDGVGAGQGLNQFYTIFAKEIVAGTTTLGEQAIGGSNMYAVVVDATFEPPPPPVYQDVDIKINFESRVGHAQGDPDPTPAGYLPDTGAVFGDRGNGYTYGWDQLNEETRNRNAHADERYDSLNHMEKDADRIWEIELDRGLYDLFIVCGDPSNTNQINTLLVEGQVVTDPDGEDNFDEYTLTGVAVTDGRLTIMPGSGSDNAKIAFLEVTPEPATLALLGFGVAGLLIRRKR